MDDLRGLDAWIEGRHITDDPRSPYYDGPECVCDDGDGSDPEPVEGTRDPPREDRADE